ncbi:MAG: septum formation initiator family protein [Lachnospiraceae bacterium]|nr:septum formation initiator family protein [Lachnospiraceae bacterium]MBP5254090.1 septum formation initiator family protein [Lachnospiraceae bacterium]
MKRTPDSMHEPYMKTWTIRLVVLVTLIVLVVFSVGIIRNYREQRDLDAHIRELQESIAEASEARASLEAQKDRELTDEDMIRIARERFGLVFPNEIIFMPEE